MPSEPSEDTIFAEIADERRSIAHTIADFTPKQLAARSLCQAWTVHGVAAHLVVPLIVPIWRFAMVMLRNRGDFDLANQQWAEKVRLEHGDELPELLTTHADNRFTPPGRGPSAPLTDLVVHGLDMCRPLGVEHRVPDTRLTMVLDSLVPASGAAPFKGPELRLHWRATDLDWSRGEGPTIEGTAASLALALTGRSSALADISGPGADQLAAARANRRR